jgi:hypothetical protein
LDTVFDFGAVRATATAEGDLVRPFGAVTTRDAGTPTDSGSGGGLLNRGTVFAQMRRPRGGDRVVAYVLVSAAPRRHLPGGVVL